MQKVQLKGRDGATRTVTNGKDYVNVARSSKSSINYFGENLPHCEDWYLHRAAMKSRITNLERQLKNARAMALLLRDLVIAEELKDEATYPREEKPDNSDTIDIIKELEEPDDSDNESDELNL